MQRVREKEVRPLTLPFSSSFNFFFHLMLFTRDIQILSKDQSLEVKLA